MYPPVSVRPKLSALQRSVVSRLHTRIILNHRMLDASKARASPVTPAALYGRGVFTTLAVHQGQPFLWQDHWARLIAHAERVKVDASTLDEETTRALLLKLLAANAVQDGRARLTLLANSARDGVWSLNDEEQEARTLLLIMTGDAHDVPHDALALTVSPYRLNTMSPLAGIKSVNYLEHLLAWEEARARDFHEAVMLNERGEVVSATMANIFWVKGGALHTPQLSTGALAGTTRACVLNLAEELGIPIVEGVNDLAQLGDADEIFLTSAGLGLAVVTTFDFHHYTIPVGSVALRLHEAFRQLILQP